MLETIDTAANPVPTERSMTNRLGRANEGQAAQIAARIVAPAALFAFTCAAQARQQALSLIKAQGAGRHAAAAHQVTDGDAALTDVLC